MGTFGNGRQSQANGGVVRDLGTSTEEAVADPYYLLRLSGGQWRPYRIDENLRFVPLSSVRTAFSYPHDNGDFGQALPGWRDHGSISAIDVATGKPYYHLYFLFVIAGLYVATPFLRLLVDQAPGVSTNTPVRRRGLRLQQHEDGSICVGDSGSPSLFAGTDMVAGITVGGFGQCRNAVWDQRIDTPAARAFLIRYVALP